MVIILTNIVYIIWYGGSLKEKISIYKYKLGFKEKLY